MIEQCPFCESARDMIPSPWGSKMICDKPTCTFLRTLERLRNDSEKALTPVGRPAPRLA